MSIKKTQVGKCSCHEKRNVVEFGHHPTCKLYDPEYLATVDSRTGKPRKASKSDKS